MKRDDLFTIEKRIRSQQGNDHGTEAAAAFHLGVMVCETESIASHAKTERVTDD